MYSYGPLHMAVQKQDDQHEHIFSNYVRIQDVVLKTCLRRWTIGKSGERGSGISVLPARHDDDDYCYPVQVFHTSVSRWFLSGVWMTASLLMSPRLFLVFWPISLMLLFGLSSLVLLFPSPPVPVSILWWLCQEHQLQSVSSSLLCFTVFSIL